jgi:hypothetical protein
MNTSTSSAACASCGRPVSGKFCVHCGSSTEAGSSRKCERCQAPLAPGVKFCGQCGAGVGASSGQQRVGWFAAGGVTGLALAGMVFLLARGQTTPPAAAETPPDAAAIPDISSMSPRERFDRLYNRIMQAAQTGNESQVTTFAPMALSAYEQLDEFDADARYHAALIRLHTGDIAGATALADTILKAQPGHLFGYIVRGTVARFQKNDVVLRRSYRDFLSHYDAELKAARPEYADHKPALEQFQRQAKDEGGGTP